MVWIAKQLSSVPRAGLAMHLQRFDGGNSSGLVPLFVAVRHSHLLPQHAPLLRDALAAVFCFELGRLRLQSPADATG